MGVHNYRGHVYMSSLASLKSHWSSCGKTGKKLNTTPVPLGTKEGAFCTYLANKTNRAYARLEVYARLPGVKPQNIPDWRLLREHTHTHTRLHTHNYETWLLLISSQTTNITKTSHIKTNVTMYNLHDRDEFCIIYVTLIVRCILLLFSMPQPLLMVPSSLFWSCVGWRHRRR